LAQAYRLFWQEEDRTFQELDTLLGAARAEALLNGEGVGGSIFSATSSSD
jgi:hypothetical protein